MTSVLLSGLPPLPHHACACTVSWQRTDRESVVAQHDRNVVRIRDALLVALVISVRVRVSVACGGS